MPKNTTASLETEIRKIIARQLGLDLFEVEVRKNISQDLGGDSLDHREINMKVEDEFEVDIPIEDEGKLVTVQDYINFVQDCIDSVKEKQLT